MNSLEDDIIKACQQIFFTGEELRRTENQRRIDALESATQHIEDCELNYASHGENSMEPFEGQFDDDTVYVIYDKDGNVKERINTSKV
jgi:hypothetical protein